MIPVDDALARVTGAASLLGAETVALADALGRVLAAPVHSAHPLPPFDQSAVDGYAVRYADIASVPVTLPVKGVVAARGYADRPWLDLGTMMRIFTGGVVPDGADTIVRQEATEPGGDERTTVTQPIALGTDLRRTGEELAHGALIAEAGSVVTPGLVGALALAGAEKVSVRAMPRVTVFVTGDEVVPLGDPLQLGQVPDTNGPLMVAHLRSWGVLPVEVAHVADTPADVGAALERAFASSDLVLTSGGVSVGDYDFIPRVAESLGAEVLLWKVAQRPGMPLFVARRGSCLLMGLPGNPGAVFVNLHVYVRAVLDAMAGLDSRTRWRRAAMPKGVRREPGKTFWLRGLVRYGDDGVARIEQLGHQASHMLSNLAAATALVRMPPEGQDADIVEWLPL
ncbi:MAG TPA: gephyrin-like molybdotransferase Glp [Acidimicrobiales bacterium]|nr:gephyrin-like molybdotransferase Glp [Acidimicrobiales bacterium]